jgi:alkanesulfonate monooxygenase SsuD/methylene tetrahydromethanopterin reductase-like flavin-dependent oxidoreductase (luciferase family)
MGPRSLARAARWADGVSGFTLLGDPKDADRLFRAAEKAWRDAGRDDDPRRITGVFVCLGPGAESTLDEFAVDYLRVFGDDLAQSLAGAMRVNSPERLRATITAMNDTGCDELILVPTSADPQLLDRLTDVVASR